jgi:hypothetical protein
MSMSGHKVLDASMKLALVPIAQRGKLALMLAMFVPITIVHLKGVAITTPSLTVDLLFVHTMYKVMQIL